VLPTIDCPDGNAPVRKAIFPAAGLGNAVFFRSPRRSRKGSAARRQATIQYASRRRSPSGIEQVSWSPAAQAAIVDHFDRSLELEHYLTQRGKTTCCTSWSESTSSATGSISRTCSRKEPLGLGHAVWTARRLVEGEPCAVLLADDVILGTRSPA